MKKINVSSAHSAAGPGLWGRMEPRGDGALAGSGLAGSSLSRRPQTAGRQENSACHRKGDQWVRWGSADWGGWWHL